MLALGLLTDWVTSSKDSAHLGLHGYLCTTQCQSLHEWLGSFFYVLLGAWALSAQSAKNELLTYSLFQIKISFLV